MLVPSGLTKKQRKEYDERNVHKAKKFVNVGPAAGLRPVGGDFAVLVVKAAELEEVAKKTVETAEAAFQVTGEKALEAETASEALVTALEALTDDVTDEIKLVAETAKIASDTATKAAETAEDKAQAAAAEADAAVEAAKVINKELAKAKKDKGK